MNLKLFDEYHIIDQWILVVTLEYLGDIRVDLCVSYGVCRCGTTPMGSQESLLRLPGHRVARRAGLVDSTRIVYPGSGHEDA